MQRYKPLKKKNKKVSLLTNQLCSFLFIVTWKVQNKKRGGQDFLCGLWNRVGVQYGHLVGRDSLSVSLIMARGAAYCGSIVW